MQCDAVLAQVADTQHARYQALAEAVKNQDLPQRWVRRVQLEHFLQAFWQLDEERTDLMLEQWHVMWFKQRLTQQVTQLSKQLRYYSFTITSNKVGL